MKYISIIFLFLFVSSCKKIDEFLDKKRLSTDVVPKTLDDFQKMLNEVSVFNQYYSVTGNIGTDNLYVTQQKISALPQFERNVYLWKKDLWEGGESPDFTNSYKAIGYANIVLEGLKNLNPSINTNDYNRIFGEALFFRSIRLYELAQLFCKPYNKATASSDPGLQLRTTSDPNVTTERSTVEETYKMILSDLHTAIDKLNTTSPNTTRPNKIAAMALLAKTFLVMKNYDSAYFYSNAVLGLKNDLIDFNTVNSSTSYRFNRFSLSNYNPEVIFYAEGRLSFATVPASFGNGQIDTTLYDSYSNTDLRKTVFYKDYGARRIIFQGTYVGNFYNFCGLATNEMYFIAAESSARLGQSSQAIDLLNTILQKRYINGTFIPYDVNSVTDKVKLILDHRRKEFPLTAQIRWEDLRRLNYGADLTYSSTIKHYYNNQEYTLTPNSPLYIFPFSNSEVQRSGIQQNER